MLMEGFGSEMSQVQQDREIVIEILESCEFLLRPLFLVQDPVWGCGLLGKIPGISESGASEDTQKFIDALKKSSSFNKAWARRQDERGDPDNPASWSVISMVVGDFQAAAQAAVATAATALAATASASSRATATATATAAITTTVTTAASTTTTMTTMTTTTTTTTTMTTVQEYYRELLVVLYSSRGRICHART